MAVFLSVVMPLFNEGHVIHANLHRTAGALREIGRSFELVVVDDGSEDHSRPEIERAASEIPELRPFFVPHCGKGEALRHGARQTQGEWVIFIDGDLDLPPEQILLFLALQKVRQADAVIGCKRHPDSTVNYPWLRRIYSTGYFWLTRLLFQLPVRDTQTGLKLVRRDLLMTALEKTTLNGYAFDLELLVRLVRLGARMIEAPVVVEFHYKLGGVGAADIWQVAADTWSVWKARH
jgi:glycosyltransferase involved in cell wall biosynthesis